MRLLDAGLTSYSPKITVSKKLPFPRNCSKHSESKKYCNRFIQTFDIKLQVNLFGVISYNGPNTIYSVSTNLKSKEVMQLMRRKVVNGIRDSIVLLDNASIHSQCMKYLVEQGILVLDFPPKSNDINIIENVWEELQKILNRKLRNFAVSTKDQLLQLIEESWKEIPSDFIRKCSLSMPRRLEEVIRMKGKQTRY